MFNIDVTIFTIFIIMTLIIGILSSRGITTIKEFALDGRNFSTMTLAATIIATWISGSIFTYSVSETYKNGLHFIIPIIGNGISLMIVGLLLIPRMGEFLGKLSIAEAMGEIYGKYARLIIAVVGTIGCIGIIAAQFKASSKLMILLFDVDSTTATLISSMVVIFYSAFGGIRAVTFTDMMQFLAFAIIVPIVTFTLWQSFNDNKLVFTTIANSSLFDFKEIFNYQNPRFLIDISILLFFTFPRMNPALFQRVSMAKNTSQAIKAFLIAGFCCLVVELFICWIGVLLYAKDGNLQTNELLSFLVEKYSTPGFKGLVIAGVMAMVMSTSDSYINSSSVMFSHDFCKIFNLTTKKNELFLSRIFSICVGLFALILALYATTILGLLMIIAGIYASIVTIPFLLSIFGFRSSFKSFLIAALFGIFVTITWKIYLQNIIILDSLIPGMIANLIALFSSHYLLKQPGGWVGIADGGRFVMYKKERKYKWQQRIKQLKKFDFIEFCLKNKPKSETTYPLFALFSIASIYSGMFTIDESIRSNYAVIMDKIFHSVIILSSLFLTYPIWPTSLKSNKFIGLVWNLGLFYILIFASTLQVIVSDFDTLQVMVFMINILILGLLSRWYVALFMSVIGVFLSSWFFKFYFETDIFPGHMGNVKFQLIYALLLTTSTLLVFVRPKQEQHKLSQQKLDHFDQKITDLEKRITELDGIKSAFLQNIPHESNTPLMGVTSLVESLQLGFQQFSKETIRDILQEIIKSSERLKTYVNNITDLSRITTGNYKLEIAEINLGDLVYQQVENNKKLYLSNEKKESLQFYLDIEEKLIYPCDRKYITKVIDNIIINAIQYSDNGEIQIKLKQNRKTKEILFSVSDQGIGIPKIELLDIFAPFTVSSRTKSQAGGRGIGLAVANQIIKLHKGKIWAENNKDYGSTFFVQLNNKL
ncbi:MAG: hypothetical protein HRU35_01925 [Rickettsiaceae bacterium]|nr:hypothetical protein [Rickettsiaceae bacterium]